MATDDDSAVSNLLETSYPKQKRNLISDEDLAWEDSYLVKDPEIPETNLDCLSDVLLNIRDSYSGAESDGLAQQTDSEAKQKCNLIPDEDLAWADSCLINDPEIPETNMDAMKFALLDILDSYTAAQSESVANGTDNEVLPSIAERRSSHNPEIAMTETVPTNESAETNVDGPPRNKNPDVPLSTQNAFLPTYKDEIRVIDIGESIPTNEFAETKNEGLQEKDNPNSPWSLKKAILPTYNGETREIDMGETIPTNELSETNNNGIPDKEDHNLLWSSKEAFASMYKDEMREIGIGRTVPTNESEETNIDGFPDEDDPSSPWSLKKAFLPTYKGREIEYSDSDEELNTPAFVMESSSEDIFKVWDLGIQVEEEYELVKQLNKALSESTVMADESLDNLVESIADLSLN